MSELIKKIDTLITNELGEYSPSDLNDIIIDLINNHDFYMIQEYHIDYLTNDLKIIKERYNDNKKMVIT